MNTTRTLGFLFRSLLLTSFTSLVACSSVLQANRLSKAFPQQPAEIMADVSSESGSEKVPFTNDPQQLNAEATYGSPIPIASGYRWVFILKEGSQNSPGLGYWVVKSNN